MLWKLKSTVFVPVRWLTRIFRAYRSSFSNKFQTGRLILFWRVLKMNESEFKELKPNKGTLWKYLRLPFWILLVLKVPKNERQTFRPRTMSEKVWVQHSVWVRTKEAAGLEKISDFPCSSGLKLKLYKKVIYAENFSSLAQSISWGRQFY